MRKKEIKIGAYGLHQYDLYGTIWTPDDGVVTKVIHVVHGMTEHMGRYEAFAEDLTPYGIAVVGFDLRGHGRNSGDLECASFMSGQKIDGEYGWGRSVEDIKATIKYFKKYFPTQEYYLLGFSLGSFLVRDYIRRIPMENDITGIILAGTGYQPAFVTGMMKIIAKSQIPKANVGGTTDLVRRLAFGTYNSYFDPEETGCGMEWLCSDKEQLSIYMKDPLVKKDIAADLFYEMISCMHKVNKKRRIGKNVNDLSRIPVIIFSGSDDAVGNMGKGIHKVMDVLETYNAKSIKRIILKNARHDIFHEYKSGAYDRMVDALIRWFGIYD